jgi:hypothetical protein
MQLGPLYIMLDRVRSSENTVGYILVTNVPLENSGFIRESSRLEDCSKSGRLLLLLEEIFPYSSVVAVVDAGKVETSSKTASVAGPGSCLVLEKASRDFAKAGRPVGILGEQHLFSSFFTSADLSDVETAYSEVESAGRYCLEAAAEHTGLAQTGIRQEVKRLTKPLSG